MSLDDYGEAFRDTFALLHGGRPGEADEGGYRPGESGQAFLARTRAEVLEKAGADFAVITPPAGLEEAHAILLQLLEKAVQAERALSEQVEAYSREEFQESMEHSNRLERLVAESGELDRRLIVTLLELDAKTPGTLAVLGLGETAAEDGDETYAGEE